ncbi:MAG TPA: hypothetical protein VFU19_13505 [Iamia sp.]|nr:hypothetical protein [Iamia sp.]
MSRRARIAEGGEVARPGDVIIPAELADRLARELTTGWRFIARSREAGPRWRPDPEMGEVGGVLGRALIAAECAASGAGSDGTPPLQGGVVTAADLAARRGVTDRRIRQQCAAGNFPGARKVGTVWLIPDPDLEL